MEASDKSLEVIEQWFKEGTQCLRAGQWADAEAVYRRMLAQGASAPSVQHNLGVALKGQRKSAEAMTIFRAVLALQPNFPEARSNLGDTLRQMGQPAQAIEELRRALALRPEFPDACNNLGIALCDTDRRAEAIEAFRRAVAIRPDFSEAWNNLGNALHEMKRSAEAVEAYRQGLAIRPEFPDAWNNLGHTLHEMKRPAEAIEAFRRAVAIRPEFAEAWNNLGHTLHETKRPAEAIEAFHRAVTIRPEFSEAWINLASTLRDVNRLAEAIQACRQALKARPDLAYAWSNLGIILHDNGQLVEAIEAYHRALGLQENLPEVWVNLGVTMKDMGQLDKSMACYDRAIALQPDFLGAHDRRLYNLHYYPNYDAAAIYRAAQQWNDQFARPHAGEIRNHDNDPDPKRRLRIGYVSPDFRGHCESLFILPLLAHHDHQTYEIFCYSNVETPDAVTARHQPHADVWRDIEPLTDQAAAQLIRQDRIDILVDLSMHTIRNRLGVFARKPAPVQVTWLGYPGTTGVETIDYRITDPMLDPVELMDQRKGSGTASEAIPIAQSAVSSSKQTVGVNQDTADSLRSLAVPLAELPADQKPSAADHHIGIQHPFYSERSVYLPDGYWCYDPSGIEEKADAEMPAPGPLPALSSGCVTFGSLNNFCKVNDPLLELWASVMAAVPESRMLLMAPAGPHREWVVGKLEVAPQRVQFVARQTRQQYMSTYQRIDICLDTLPFNGGTTSLDALWMGVPVLTRLGKTVVGRAGSSHLRLLGLPEFITRTDEEFVQRAVEWAGDLDRLSGLRAALRPRMERSPLMDGKRFAKNMESAYRNMWQAWCRTRG